MFCMMRYPAGVLRIPFSHVAARRKMNPPYTTADTPSAHSVPTGIEVEGVFRSPGKQNTEKRGTHTKRKRQRERREKEGVRERC
jgi:hypothetical protein